jgi:hypothetical protein
VQITSAHDALDASLVAAAPARAYQPDLSSQKLRDHNRTQLLQAMGAEQFEQAYLTGKSLSLEQACDLALGKDEPGVADVPAAHPAR